MAVPNPQSDTFTLMDDEKIACRTAGTTNELVMVFRAGGSGKEGTFINISTDNGAHWVWSVDDNTHDVERHRPSIDYRTTRRPLITADQTGRAYAVYTVGPDLKNGYKVMASVIGTDRSIATPISVAQYDPDNFYVMRVM